MESFERLLLENRAWAFDKLSQDPKFFENQAHVQKPDFFWIGCSDSRVPANEVTNTESGEIFVHRNVANMVVNTDLNLLSVLQYAVDVLQVKHVIVCGHYGCGGVKAALTHGSYGLLNKWLRNIKDVYRFHREEIDSIANEEERLNKMIELNVQEQVMNLAKTSIIQKAWKKRQGPQLHGWIYGLNDGILHDVIRLDHNYEVDPIYRFGDYDLEA
ncbi:MAG: carbonic anhydrase [Bacteroidia bacterium]